MTGRAVDVATGAVIGTEMAEILLMRGRDREMVEGEMSESGVVRVRLVLPLVPRICCCIATSKIVRRSLHSRISFSASSALCMACLVSSS